MNKNIIDILKSLSDNTRFSIFLLLSHKSYCVKSLAKKLKISEAAVSQHLNVLKNVNLIDFESVGKWRHYSSNNNIFNSFIEDITDIQKKPLIFLSNIIEKEEEKNMCKCKNEELNKNPKECDEAQIKECHGDSENHECDCNGECDCKDDECCKDEKKDESDHKCCCHE
jgi:ArsR family transcriptional regulator